MTGNIWEWVDDAFCPYGSPGCAATHKVTRGGGWCSSDPTIQRTTTRHGDDPKTKSAIIGFRCARAL
jgi:formylglycine-generating enzyme required for sulfatase activity